MCKFEKLVTKYTFPITDQEFKDIMILYDDNTKINYINDYGRSGPTELQWFYEIIMNLNNVLNFKELSDNKIFQDNDLYFESISTSNEFDNNSKILKHTERVLLVTALITVK